MRRNWLITGLVCVLFLVLSVRLAVQFGFPAFLRAQTSSGGANETGPHAAFFDSGGNIRVANMVKSKTSKNLRITVMVDISAQTPEIDSILAATAGLTPQVRIVGVNHDTYTNNRSKAADIARALNGSQIPAGTLVVFGNEVNNLDKEWRICPDAGQGGCPDQTGTAAGEYAAFFREFQSASDPNKYTAVPSPLDMYNGNYQNNQPFFSTGIYTGTLVANVYDKGPGGLATGSNYPGGNVVAYTEYGPDPEKSLQEHLQWLNSHTPDKPATTLIPDKCSGESGERWLYYVDRKIYDAEGNEIDVVTCSGGRRGLPPVGDYYKRFIYPFYSANSTPDTIKQKLEADYTVACSNPAEYATQVSGSISELIRYQAGACKNRSGDACLFSPEAVFSLSAAGTNKLFGVLRNENEAKWRAFDYDQQQGTTSRIFTNRFESVEQWFGANNPAEKNTGEPVDYLNRTPEEISGLHQGPFYKLTSLYGQCMASGEILKASNDLCAEWSGLPENAGERCSLNEKKVYGTTRTMGELHAAVEGAGGAQAVCTAVFQAPDPNNIPQGLIGLTQDMMNVDLYMETAYRPAFLVLVTRVDPEDQRVGPGNETQKLYAQDRGGSSGKDIVDFLVYHVPATVTDVKKDTAGDADDIMTRTVRPFFTEEQTTAKENEWTQQRAGLAGPLYSPSTDPESVAVNCEGGVCEQKLRRALIDFINAYTASVPGASECKDPNNQQRESGSRIGSELAPNDSSQAFKDAKNSDSIVEGEAAIKMSEYVKDGGVTALRAEVPKTRIFNIAPYGFRTKYVADAFDALFSQTQQEEHFDENHKYLTGFEAIFGNTLESQADIASYSVPSNPPTFDEDGNPIAQRKEVKADIALSGYPPFSAPVEWLAKAFNHSTRAIVQQISGSGQALLECAAAVTDPKKNTEDFLLKCQSRGVAVASNNLNSPNQYADFALDDFEQFEIEYWSSFNRTLTVFNPPPQIVWDAAVEASNRHGGAEFCDPLLLVALAHSESQAFNNTQTENGATAMGVWQITRGNWYDMWRPLYWFERGNFTTTAEGRFNCENVDAAECSRSNIYAAADATCRFANALGMANPELYQDESKFLSTFSSPAYNPYDSLPNADRVWNLCPVQGEYVWRLWHSLREPDNRSAFQFKIEQFPACW